DCGQVVKPEQQRVQTQSLAALGVQFPSFPPFHGDWLQSEKADPDPPAAWNRRVVRLQVPVANRRVVNREQQTGSTQDRTAPGVQVSPRRAIWNVNRTSEPGLGASECVLLLKDVVRIHGIPPFTRAWFKENRRA